jgi:hypothetical protein
LGRFPWLALFLRRERRRLPFFPITGSSRLGFRFTATSGRTRPGWTSTLRAMHGHVGRTGSGSAIGTDLRMEGFDVRTGVGKSVGACTPKKSDDSAYRFFGERHVDARSVRTCLIRRVIKNSNGQPLQGERGCRIRHATDARAGTAAVFDLLPATHSVRMSVAICWLSIRSLRSSVTERAACNGCCQPSRVRLAMDSAHR